MVGFNMQVFLVFSRLRMENESCSSSRTEVCTVTVALAEQSESENHRCQPTTVTALRQTHQ